MIHSGVLFVARANFQQFNLYISYNDRVKMVLCVCVMATNFLELATTLKYLGAKWLSGKKVNFTPWFYFIWSPCCSCLFSIRALVALVLFYLGPLLLLFILN